MARYQLVEEPDTLVSQLGDSGQIGVDTEFMRERTYFAQLCLVQLATADDIWCVDPLSGHEQQSFWQKLMAHDWVVHSARQDIEVVYQTAQAMPESIFDTQVAAGLLGHPPQMGYAGLVKELFGVEIHKTHTRADWSKRPLREEYLLYAAEDVEYLLPAFAILAEKLEACGRMAWAREDSQWLLDPALYEIGDDQAIDRVKGARNFRGRKRTVAARLAAWREAEAIRRNRPRQWIMRDNVLLDIAWKLPTSLAALAALDGIPSKLVKRVGEQLLEAVATASENEDYRPPAPPDEAQKALLKEMQARVAACAADLGIAAETVASKRELSAIIIAGNRASRVFSGWRAGLIGDELLSLL